MSGAIEKRALIRPTLHHFGLTTSSPEATVDWYANVLGMVPTHLSSTPSGALSTLGLRASSVTNDGANHRIAIMELPGLTGDPERSRNPRLQHVAFELTTIDDLLAICAPLKGLEIKPVRTADHGATTAFRYEDPDRNSVELTVDNFGDWQTSSDYMRQSPAFAANPVSSYVDLDELIAARAAGMAVDELPRRAYAGEFPPHEPMEPRRML